LGSQFPDDREDYSYSVLRRIMVSDLLSHSRDISFFFLTSFCHFRCVLKMADH